MITYKRTKTGESVYVDGRKVGSIGSYYEHGILRYRYRPVGSTTYCITAPMLSDVKKILAYGQQSNAA